MERFLWICLAGAAGTGARYLIALWAAQRFGSSFPFGTLIVNLVGCFAIAAVMHAAVHALLVSDRALGHHHRLHRWPDDVFEFQLRNDSSDGGRRDRRGGRSMQSATIVGAFAAGWLGMVCARQLLGR